MFFVNFPIKLFILVTFNLFYITLVLLVLHGDFFNNRKYFLIRNTSLVYLQFQISSLNQDVALSCTGHFRGHVEFNFLRDSKYF